uniref:Ras-related GTP-binding protein n=3 Tax=Agamidae TaxID=81953 RepID=A0ABM5EW97_9SAUR
MGKGPVPSRNLCGTNGGHSVHHGMRWQVSHKGTAEKDFPFLCCVAWCGRGRAGLSSAGREEGRLGCQTAVGGKRQSLVTDSWPVVSCSPSLFRSFCRIGMPNTAMKKKVLLMGKSGSGKTSMRSIIFANYIARDTRRLGATIDVEHSHVRFLGNLVLNLWDCGGQDTFMENYFTSQRDNIFRNVEVLIYVFDVESRELEKDMHYYQSCLEAILQNSPDAKIFCLVHKMDLVQEDQRDLIFKEREEDLKRLSRPLECACFRTSIWDETLYKAWSSIVYQLIPNVQQLEMNLRNFAQIIEADEVLLFERATFLVISHYQCKEQRDIHRFEKISNIIKQFKLSCSKLAASFQSMEVRNSNFAAFIDIFTSNTYVMVVMSDPSIPSAATLINIRNARKHFEKLERVDGPKHSLLVR